MDPPVPPPSEGSSTPVRPPRENVAFSVPPSKSKDSPVVSVREMPIVPGGRKNRENSSTIIACIKSRPPGVNHSFGNGPEEQPGRLCCVSGVVRQIPLQEYLAQASPSSQENPMPESRPTSPWDPNKVYSPETGEPSREMTRLPSSVQDADGYRKLFLDHMSGQEEEGNQGLTPQGNIDSDAFSNASDETVRVVTPGTPKHPRWMNVEETPAEAEAERRTLRDQEGLAAAFASVMSDILALNDNELDEEGVLRPVYDDYEPRLTSKHSMRQNVGNALVSQLQQLPNALPAGKNEKAWLTKNEEEAAKKIDELYDSIKRDECRVNLQHSPSFPFDPPTFNLSNFSNLVFTNNIYDRSLEKISQHHPTKGDKHPTIGIDTGAMPSVASSAPLSPRDTTMPASTTPNKAAASPTAGNKDIESLGDSLDTFFDVPTSPREKTVDPQQKQTMNPATRKASAQSFASNSSYKTAPMCATTGQQHGPQNGQQHGHQQSGSQYGPQGDPQDGPRKGLQNCPQNYGPNNPPPPAVQSLQHQRHSSTSNMQQAQWGQVQWHQNQQRQQIQQMGHMGPQWQRPQRFFQYPMQHHMQEVHQDQGHGINGPHKQHQVHHNQPMPHRQHFVGPHGNNPMMPMHGPVIQQTPHSPMFFGPQPQPHPHQMMGPQPPPGFAHSPQPVHQPMHPHVGFPPGNQSYYAPMGPQPGHHLQRMPPSPRCALQHPHFYQGITGPNAQPDFYHPPMEYHPPMAHQLPPPQQPPIFRTLFNPELQQRLQQKVKEQQKNKSNEPLFPSAAAVIEEFNSMKLEVAPTPVPTSAPKENIPSKDDKAKDDTGKQGKGREEFTFKAAQERLQEELKKQGLPAVDLDEAAKNAEAKKHAATRGRSMMRGNMGGRGTGHRGGGFRVGHHTGTPHNANVNGNAGVQFEGHPTVPPMLDVGSGVSGDAVPETPRNVMPPTCPAGGGHCSQGLQQVTQTPLRVNQQVQQYAIPHVPGTLGQQIPPQIPQQAQPQVRLHSVARVHGILGQQIPPHPGFNMPPQPPRGHPAQPQAFFHVCQNTPQSKQSRFFPMPPLGMNAVLPPDMPLPTVPGIPPPSPPTFGSASPPATFGPVPPPPTVEPAAPRAPAPKMAASKTNVPKTALPQGKMSADAILIHEAYKAAMALCPPNLSPRSAKRWVPPGHFANGLHNRDPVSGLTMIEWYSEEALANNPGLLEVTGVDKKGKPMKSGYNDGKEGEMWAHPMHVEYLKNNKEGTFKESLKDVKLFSASSQVKYTGKKKANGVGKNTAKKYGGKEESIPSASRPAAPSNVPVGQSAPLPPVASQTEITTPTVQRQPAQQPVHQPVHQSGPQAAQQPPQQTPPPLVPTINTLPAPIPTDRLHLLGFEIPPDKLDDMVNKINKHIIPYAESTGTVGLDRATGDVDEALGLSEAEKEEREKEEKEEDELYKYVVDKVVRGSRFSVLTREDDGEHDEEDGSEN